MTTLLWKESDFVVDQMIKGSTGELWGNRLENTNHFSLLNFLLKEVGQKGLLLDIGCGSGDVSRVWNGEYLGFDLPWVIERVSKVCNPSAKFMHIDIQKDALENFPSCKCILMNALLDVLENPVDVLQAICKNISTEYIVVHRQKLSDVDSIQYGKGYGDSIVAISQISIETLKKACDECGVKNITIYHWEDNYYSFILEMQ